MEQYSKEDKKGYKKLSKSAMKDMVNDWMLFYKDNIDRFNQCKRFAIKSTLDSAHRSLVDSVDRPIIEVNGLNQIIAREKGQFAMNEPGFEVSLEDGFMFQEIPQDILQQAEFIEGNIRHEFSNKSNDMLAYRTFDDQLTGGWSAWEMKEEYTSERSMEKRLVRRRTYHPTLTGWDPTAIDSHKGDGMYCFELVPMRISEYERKFGEFKEDKSFAPSSIGQVSWSYVGMKEKMCMVCYFYHKEKKKIKLYQLENGKLVTKKEYNELLEWWDMNDVPGIPPKMRKINGKYVYKEGEREAIWRYVFSEASVFECEKTELPFLPYIFVDGNSAVIGNEGNQFEQFTVPFIWYAMGLQKIKDMAFQTMAAEINGWTQSPVMVPYESIENLPQKYLDAWLSPQKKSLLTFNLFNSKYQGQQMVAPIPLQKQETPQILMQFLSQVDVMIQHVMGSSDAQLANEGPHMSGKAIMQAMIKSSATARPYVISYTAAMERAAQFYIYWMKKNMVNERIAPIIDREGKMDMRGINLNQGSLRYMPIDQEKKRHLLETNINLNFMPDMMKIKVTPGNSVDAQKDLALQTLATNSKVFPALAGLVNEKGLEVILNNIDIKDIDILKAEAPSYMEEMAEARKNKPQDPAIIATQMQIQAQKEMKMMDMQAKGAELAIKKQGEDTKYIQAVAKINQSETEMAIEQERIDATNARTRVMDMAELAHTKHLITKDMHGMALELGEHHRKQQKHEKEMTQKPEEKEEVEMIEETPLPLE